MIYTMIRGDLLRFCLIFLVFMFGFTQALHVLYVRVECDNDFDTVISAFFNMFCVTLQQVTDVYENFGRHPSAAIQVIAKVMKSSGKSMASIDEIIFSYSDLVCYLYRDCCRSISQHVNCQ